MEQNNIEFKVKLELKDYQALNFWHMFKSSGSKLTLIFTVILILVSPALLYFYFDSGDTVALIIFLIDIFCLFLLFVLMPLSILISSKSVYKSDKFLQEEQNFLVDNDQMIVNTETSTFKVKWNEIYRGIDDKRYFFIYVAKIKALIIPKNQISSDKIEFLRERINEHKKVK